MSTFPLFRRAGGGRASVFAIGHGVHHLLRVLVFAQPLKGGVAKDAIGRPVGELHLRHEARLDPAHALQRRALRHRRRRSAAFQAGEPLLQLGEQRVAEPGADPPGIMQRALVVVIPEQ